MADHEVIHGGPAIPWDHSVRGKLHLLMTERAARRHTAKVERARFTRGEAICLLAFALIQTSIALATFIVAVRHG